MPQPEGGVVVQGNRGNGNLPAVLIVWSSPSRDVQGHQRRAGAVNAALGTLQTFVHTIIIIILRCLTSLDSSKPIQKIISVNHEGLRTPIYIVVIVAAGKKMQTRNEEQFLLIELPSEESHPVTDPLGENSRNRGKKQKSVLQPNQIQ